MTTEPTIKNIPFATAVALAELVEYGQGRVVSRTLAQHEGVSVTLFAFDAGEGLSTHTAPGDALVYVLDGTAEITVDNDTMSATRGEAVVMPANVPHAVHAKEPFKMLLVVVKPLQDGG